MRKRGGRAEGRKERREGNERKWMKRKEKEPS